MDGQMTSQGFRFKLLGVFRTTICNHSLLCVVSSSVPMVKSYDFSLGSYCNELSRRSLQERIFMVLTPELTTWTLMMRRIRDWANSFEHSLTCFLTCRLLTRMAILHNQISSEGFSLDVPESWPALLECGLNTSRDRFTLSFVKVWILGLTSDLLNENLGSKAHSWSTLRWSWLEGHPLWFQGGSVFRQLGDCPVQILTMMKLRPRERQSPIWDHRASPWWRSDQNLLFLLDQLLPDNRQERMGFRVKIIIVLPTLNLYLTVSPNFLRIMSIK